MDAHARVEVLLELLEVQMRDNGGLMTARSALRYLMTLISRAFSRRQHSDDGRGAGTSCTSVKSLRIVDPSMPSTGKNARSAGWAEKAAPQTHDRNSVKSLPIKKISLEDSAVILQLKGYDTENPSSPCMCCCTTL